jgi:two-component system cell cycle response regulator
MSVESKDNLITLKANLLDLLLSTTSSFDQKKWIVIWCDLISQHLHNERVFFIHGMFDEQVIPNAKITKVTNHTFTLSLHPPIHQHTTPSINFPFFNGENNIEIFLFSYEDQPFGYLMLEDTKHIFQGLEFRKQFSEFNQLFVNELLNKIKSSSDKDRLSNLFEVTETFHSTLQMDKLLHKIEYSLQNFFSEWQSEILLSSDPHQLLTKRVRMFDFNQADELAMKSFLNMTIERKGPVGHEPYKLYVPLKGSQGVYGLLVVRSPWSFSEKEISYIHLFASAISRSLENAKLYQQSQKWVNDLQTINDMSQKLNTNLRLNDIFVLLKEKINELFCPTSVGFMLINENGTEVLAESDPIFQEKEGALIQSFVSTHMLNEKEPLFIGDLLSKLNNNTSYRSLMAVPVMQESDIKGYVICLHESEYAFTFEMFKLLQSFIQHSSLAVVNSLLRAKLEHTVITDQLTHLYTRYYINKVMKSSFESDENGVFILLDLDNFKKINDTFGHQTGDDVLIKVSELIKSCIPKEAIGARWGGEELCVYLPGHSIEEGIAIAREIGALVSEETIPPITVSSGVSYWKKGDQLEVKTLFKAADKALYRAKEDGKNQVVAQDGYSMLPL